MSKPARDWRNWVKKAEEDVQAIRLLMAGRDVPWSVVSFHAQQAAEKYLKAFLVSRGVDPERIHSLDRLLANCLPYDSTVAALRDDCQRLTDYAVDIRYPDIPIADEERIAREAVAMAERICAAIRQRLPSN
jgi:HEPN domain-containing protein